MKKKIECLTIMFLVTCWLITSCGAAPKTQYKIVHKTFELISTDSDLPQCERYRFVRNIYYVENYTFIHGLLKFDDNGREYKISGDITITTVIRKEPEDDVNLKFPEDRYLTKEEWNNVH